MYVLVYVENKKSIYQRSYFSVHLSHKCQRKEKYDYFAKKMCCAKMQIGLSYQWVVSSLEKINWYLQTKIFEMCIPQNKATHKISEKFNRP